MEPLQAGKMSRGLKALSDVNRIRILEILVRGEHCVSDLVEKLKIDQPKVSHHLAILRGAGVIRSRRDGRHINYSIKPNVLRQTTSGSSSEDIFDLGDIVVSFRFGGATAVAPRVAPAVRTAGEAATRERAAEHG